jgi:hypothetical protein
MPKLTPAGIRVFFDAAVFQIAWFICVLGGSRLAVIFTIANLILHAHWLQQKPLFAAKWLVYVLFGSALGIIVDQLAIEFGLFIFPSGQWVPIWLMCLWLNFMMTLHFSLYWLEKSRWLTCLIGGIGGAYSYFLGESLGQVVLPHHWLIDGAFLFISWAILLPLFVHLKKYCLPKNNPTLALPLSGEGT